VAVDAVPVKLAVIVPAEKLPEPSRLTIAPFVLASVAPSNFVLSAADIDPGSDVEAADIVIFGVDPPLEAIGADAVTAVTVDGDPELTHVLPL